MIDAIIALICFTIYMVKSKYDKSNGGDKLIPIGLENAIMTY
jgi:hypothetical protein